MSRWVLHAGTSPTNTCLPMDSVVCHIFTIWWGTHLQCVSFYLRSPPIIVLRGSLDLMSFVIFFDWFEVGVLHVKVLEIKLCIFWIWLVVCSILSIKGFRSWHWLAYLLLRCWYDCLLSDDWCWFLLPELWTCKLLIITLRSCSTPLDYLIIVLLLLFKSSLLSDKLLVCWVSFFESLRISEGIHCVISRGTTWADACKHHDLYFLTS